MKIRQLSVFLENRIGRLDELIRLLGDNQINIRAIAVADTASFGIIRLIVDQLEQAEQVLASHQFVCKLNEVTVISVKDSPGGLAEVLDVIHQNGINIEYMYALAEHRGSRPLMVFRFDDVTEQTIASMKAAGIDILEAEQL